MCSTEFATLGRAQARALGCADLPITVVPHPFGLNARAKVRALAEICVQDIEKLVCAAAESGVAHTVVSEHTGLTVQVDDSAEAVNLLFCERQWTDGLPIVPPTAERVDRMMKFTPRAPDDVVGIVAPGFGAATVRRIAINAVMAGCHPEYLPVLIAAVEAVTAPEFNLQAIQVTTNPAAVWLIVNGPVARRLCMNAGVNCLGQGNWANATLGRALRLVMQNIGRAFPGEMDRATQGHPGKYMFCCAENEADSPWEPLHVERGFRAEQSAVTVVGAEGAINMNTHSKSAEEIVRVVAETMPRPPSNDYTLGGDPWVVFCPEHAQILRAAGLSKVDVKRQLWEQSKMVAGRMAAVDLQRTRIARLAELGAVMPDTMLPISPSPDRIGILVAGGPGTHSIYIPSFADTSRATTREVIWAG